MRTTRATAFRLLARSLLQERHDLLRAPEGADDGHERARRLAERLSTKKEFDFSMNAVVYVSDMVQQPGLTRVFY